MNKMQKKFKAALEYQNQGYSFEEICKFLDYKAPINFRRLVNKYGGSVINGVMTIDPDNLKRIEYKKKLPKGTNTITRIGIKSLLFFDFLYTE